MFSCDRCQCRIICLSVRAVNCIATRLILSQMWCAGQSDTSAQLWRSAPWSSTSTTSCPQSGLPKRGVQSPNSISAVADHSWTAVSNFHVEGHWSVRCTLDTGTNVLSSTQPVTVGHDEYYHRRNSAVHRARGQITAARGVGRWKNSGFSCTTAATGRDNTHRARCRGVVLLRLSLSTIWLSKYCSLHFHLHTYPHILLPLNLYATDKLIRLTSSTSRSM